jgi:peptide/nickel transport system permease protein
MATTTYNDSGAAPTGGAAESALRRFRRSHPVFLFVVRRVAAGLLTLLVASMLIFAAVQVLPGNVAEVVLGRNATPQLVHSIESELHLDESIPAQYVHWLGNLVTGNLGNSTASLAQGQQVSVSHLIATPLRNSLILAGLTLIFFIPLCLILGTIAALRAGRKSDHAISLSSLAIGSMPEFLIGTLLIVIFFSNLEWLPGVSTIEEGQSPFAHIDSLVLPVLTLLCVSTAFGVRLLRASLVEVLREDYVGMARLNGVPERKVIRRYVLRNGLAPAIQALAQVIQYLIGGIIIVEAVFNYPGIGTTLVEAVQVRDLQVVSVVAVILAAIYVLVNILADLAVVLVVPRLRTQL